MSAVQPSSRPLYKSLPLIVTAAAAVVALSTLAQGAVTFSGAAPTTADLEDQTTTPNLLISSGNTLAVTGGSVIKSGLTRVGTTNGAAGGVATVTGSGSIWHIPGASSLEVGTATNSNGTITLSDNAILNTLNTYIARNASANGVVNVMGGAIWNSAATITVGQTGTGAVNIESGGLVHSENGLNFGYSGGTGIVTIAGGTLDLNGANAGIGTGSGSILINSGTLTDVGTSSVSINQVGGLFEIGATSKAGTTTVNANYTLGNAGILEMELFGNGGLTEIDLDRLTVNGVGSLGGTVKVVLVGYAPQFGDTFDLLDFASFVNTGYSIDLSDAELGAGLLWDDSAFETAGVLTVVPEPAGLSLLALAGLGAFRRRRTA